MHNFIEGGEAEAARQKITEENIGALFFFLTANTRQRAKNTGVSPRCARAGRGTAWPRSRCPPPPAAASSSVNIPSSRGAARSPLSAKKVLS